MHPGVRIGELIALLALVGAVLAFLLRYNDRIVLLEERQAVVRSEIQDFKKNGVPTSSPETVRRFIEVEKDYEHLQKELDKEKADHAYEHRALPRPP